MNYYDEILEKIKAYIEKGKYEVADEMISEELDMPYIPEGFDIKLLELRNQIPILDNTNNLDDEKINSYLYGSIEQQLVAVEVLNNKNLRDYIRIINDYLKSDGFINAKVLLIESLIKQEINEEIEYINAGINYSFIPKYIRLPEESYGYIKALDLLNSRFMKEPSCLEMAKQLLYKECLLALPINYEAEEGKIIASRIEDYIVNAFDNNLLK